MSFRRVSIIGTLMAAALALLILLPVLAAPGTNVAQNEAGDSLTVFVGERDLTGKLKKDDAKATRLGPILYVSNDPDAYNEVAVALARASSGSEVAVTPTITVRSGSNTLTVKGKSFIFDVVGPTNDVLDESCNATKVGEDEVGCQIAALHGDVITVTVPPLTVSLTVDAEGPEFSSISPDDGRLQSSSSVTVGFIVTDDDSGLRSDGEAGREADRDGQSAEPLSDAAHGSSADISVRWDYQADKDDILVAKLQNDESLGDRNWVELVRDHSYSVSYTRAGLQTDTYTYEWDIEAKDRVGNSTTTDASASKKGDQKFELTVDGDDPDAEGFLYAGIGFDIDDGEEVDDASSILVIFDNEKAIDSSTLDARDFDVAGNTVTGVIHPNKKKATDDDDECTSHEGSDANTGRGSVCIDTRNRVYLTLGSPLDDDDKPRVQILGGSIRDLAGNATDSLDDPAKDRIAPSLDVVVTGDVETDGRPLGQEEITVSIAAGEQTGSPEVWLAEFNETGLITTVEEGVTEDDGTNRWTVTFDGTDNEAKVAALIVRATDRSDEGGNVSTTTGYSSSGAPAKGGKLDLAKLDKAGLLLEFDADIEKADFVLNPSDDNSETESSNPFIELKFPDEGKENTVKIVDTDPDTAGDQAGTADSYTDSKDVKTKFDAYGTVTITSVTLDGDDVSGLLDRISSSVYSVSLGGLAIGEHTLAYTAMDTAGNTVKEEEDFEVVARSAYEVTLRPGWNLVSFPASPIDTSIDSVLPADHAATDVLQYAGGIWTSASRGPAGAWEGDLTDIDGEHAYWINTISTDPLEAVLAEPGTGAASRPPSLPLIAGWNLVPVADIDQGDEGTSQADYWSSLDDADFVIAYTYNASTRAWGRHTFEDDTNPVENGQGVWVYSRSNTTLIP